MSARNRHKRPQVPFAVPKPSSQPAASPNALEAELHKAHAESLSHLAPGEIPAAPNEPLPQGTGIDSLWKMVQETRTNLKAAEGRAAAREAEAAKRLTALDARVAILDEQKARLERDRAELSAQEEDYLAKIEALDGRVRELNDREAALALREADILDREINAEAGFIAKRQASLAALEQAAADLKDTLTETERLIAAERAAWIRDRQAEHNRLLVEIEAAARDQAQVLAERESELQDANRALAKRARQIERDEEAIREERAGLAERVEYRMAAEAEAFKHQLQSLQDQLDQARRDRDDLAKRLQRREEGDQCFGQRSPEQVLAELERLRVENDRLRSDLASRPDAQAAERLRVLQAERSDWQAGLIRLQQQASDAELRLARHQIAATELEMLRDQKVAAEARVAVLQKARDELHTEVGDLIGRDDTKVPFPGCIEMDDAEYQQSGETSWDYKNLKAFVADLQQRIAHNPQEPAKHLYYSLADLRCFLGGLAMGRLILLQGISGTGKTSLPLAFARAVGTRFKDDDNLIQVQAGWRDPQDLVGHYNAFEKRFYEQKFLRALYRAATPRWSDAIHIVVLDEMNLSHPEQYFSDMLSTLEQPINDRFIELMTHGAPHAPQLFIDGKRLKVPENLWFVGTANHDETTKDFADKTYDRAQVMEFAHRPEPFEVQPPPPRRKPMSYKGLQDAFDKAQKDKGSVAEEVSRFLDEELRDLLGRNFGIGWGPRLDEQLKRYCPVVVAAGGSAGEAADHLLAMRLLRKLKNRHDNRQDQLERLRDRIQGAWPKLGKGPVPSKSYAVINGELARLGVSIEDDA